MNESGNSEPLANMNTAREMFTTTTLFTEVNSTKGPQWDFLLRKHIHQMLMKDIIMASSEPSLIPRLSLLRRENLGIRPSPP